MKIRFIPLVATVALSLCSLSVFAQTTIGRLMDLEAKVTEKKMLDDLEKSSNQTLMSPIGITVPPISLVGNAARSPVPVSAEAQPRPTKRAPYAVSILGVDQELKADVVINGRQYQAIKGMMVGEYFVKSIEPSGVWLESQAVGTRKRKSVSASRVIFAPLSNF